MMMMMIVISFHENSTPRKRTVYPKKYAHGFCFAVLCCGYTLTDFPISIRLTSLALWQSNDCPSASKAILMNMDTYFMWIHYERLHNHSKAKHNKTVCIFLGINCIHRHHQAHQMILSEPISSIIFPLSLKFDWTPVFLLFHNHPSVHCNVCTYHHSTVL